MDSATLLWDLVFGAVGMGYVMYGRKQRALVPLVSGVGLMVFPYFISNPWATVGVGVVLMAIPYIVRI